MTYREFCYKFCWKAQSLICPRLKYSQDIYETILTHYLTGRERWLDLGCGHQLLPLWRLEQEKQIAKKARLFVGIDYYREALKNHRSLPHKIQGDIAHLPFSDSQFDLVTANMVFEHLRSPARQMAEVFRIMKPGGLLLFHTPNVRSYTNFLTRLVPERAKDKLVYLLEGRQEEDVFRTYYRINRVEKIREAALSAGFRIRSIKMIVSSPQSIILPPLVIPELILIRLLMTRRLKKFRTNIIAALEKP